MTAVSVEYRPNPGVAWRRWRAFVRFEAAERAAQHLQGYGYDVQLRVVEVQQPC